MKHYNYNIEDFKENPMLIRDVISPSYELQMLCVQIDPTVIDFIDQPYENVKLYSKLLK